MRHFDSPKYNVKHMHILGLSLVCRLMYVSENFRRYTVKDENALPEMKIATIQTLNQIQWCMDHL